MEYDVYQTCLHNYRNALHNKSHNYSPTNYSASVYGAHKSTLYLNRSVLFLGRLVEVFVYVVQKPQEELLSIVLQVALVLGRVTAHHVLEPGCHPRVVLPVPEALEQERKLFRHVARGAKLPGAGPVSVDVALVLVCDKELGQLVCVAEALEDGIHEACVAVVLQPLQARNVGPVGQPRQEGSGFGPPPSGRSADGARGGGAGQSHSVVLLFVPCGRDDVGRGLVVRCIRGGVFLLLSESAHEHVHKGAQVPELLLLRLPRLLCEVLPLLGVDVMALSAPSPSLSVRGAPLVISPAGVEKGRIGGVLKATREGLARGNGPCSVAAVAMMMVALVGGGGSRVRVAVDGVIAWLARVGARCGSLHVASRRVQASGTQESRGRPTSCLALAPSSSESISANQGGGRRATVYKLPCPTFWCSLSLTLPGLRLYSWDCISTLRG